MAQEALLDNVSVDVRALQLDRTGNKDVYTPTTIGIGADNATLNIHGGQYLTADGLVRDLNGNNSNSLFIGAKANSKIIIGGSAEFDRSTMFCLVQLARDERLNILDSEKSTTARSK